MAETVVRMAEHAVARGAGDVLVTIGLGSCIGLALLDRSRGIGGLAHIVLPDSRDATGNGAPAPKFANTAVPALLDQVAGLGASKMKLEAVLVGGARMFGFGRKDGAGLDIGSRNESAVRTALEAARIPIRAAATGGSRGRTIRIYVATSVVTVKEAGGAEVELLSATVVGGRAA